MTEVSPDVLVDAERRRVAQLKEYGTYQAISPIDVGNARAFNVGDPVPVGHVERFGYLDSGLVAKVDSPAAIDASADPYARPSGNASRDEWAAYAITRGLDPADVTDMSRDQLRDRFAQED